jgi:hypothetical protein
MASAVSSSSTNACGRVQSPFASHHSAASGRRGPWAAPLVPAMMRTPGDSCSPPCFARPPLVAKGALFRCSSWTMKEAAEKSNPEPRTKALTKAPDEKKTLTVALRRCVTRKLRHCQAFCRPKTSATRNRSVFQMHAHVQDTLDDFSRSLGNVALLIRYKPLQ